jgi:hypothetical protein
MMIDTCQQYINFLDHLFIHFVPFYTIKDGGQLGGGPEPKINVSEVVNRSLANFNQNILKVESSLHKSATVSCVIVTYLRI